MLSAFSVHALQPAKNGEIMKKMQSSETDEMLPEYDFDYSRARPNRFAGMTDEKKSRLIVLDPDIVGVFSTSESVNKILRAIIAAMPESAVKKRITHRSRSEKKQKI